MSLFILFIVVVAASTGWYFFHGKSEGSNTIGNSNDDTIVDQDNNTDRGDDLVYEKNAPVYVTIYSHNEDSWDSLVNTKEKYLEYRDGLLERASLLAQYDISWDWQSDQPVVEAMIANEDAETVAYGTDGKNILKYLEDQGVSLDPHAHTNNYADIVYLMKQLGVTPSSVIGGLTHVECGKEYLGFLDFMSWQDEIALEADGSVHGEAYPQARWKPEILSDPGMGRHYFDDWSTGVWRPGDGEDFYTDDPTSDIVYIGEGYPHDATIIGAEHAGGCEVHASNGQYIKELVQKIEEGELPTGTVDGDRFMYTASIHVRDKAIVEEGGSVPTDTVEGLRAVLEELQPLREAGKIIFVNFEEAADIWREEYDAVPWHVNLETFSFYDQVLEQGQAYCRSKSPLPDRVR